MFSDDNANDEQKDCQLSIRLSIGKHSSVLYRNLALFPSLKGHYFHLLKNIIDYANKRIVSCTIQNTITTF